MADATNSKKHSISTVKVGILTLLSLGTAIGVILWLQGRSLSQGPTFTVRFRDVDGLNEGAAVQLMGIRVGYIKNIHPVVEKGRYSISLTFSLARDDINLPKGSTVSIQQSGLVGEKFLEVIPPQLHSISLTIPKPSLAIPNQLPVKFLYPEGPQTVGQVEQTAITGNGQFVTVKCFYRVLTPGAQIPAKVLHKLILSADQTPYLLIQSADGHKLTPPDNRSYFTVENPLRLKRFLEIQLESAEALKATNDKINQLMSDDTIMTLRSTLKNTEHLTAQATDVLKGAQTLFQKTSKDLDILVDSGQELTNQITKVSVEVNKVIGDPAVQSDLVTTLNSLKVSSTALSQILSDPNLKQTLALTRNASADAASIIHSVKLTTEQLNLEPRLDETLSQMNHSLKQLDELLSTVNGLSGEQQGGLKDIVSDARTSAEQLKKFSKKLNGHFALFRLMF